MHRIHKINDMKKEFFSRFLLWAVMALVVVSCSKDDSNTPENEGGSYTEIPRIIMDVDIASSTDDLFALQMAYNYDHEGRCVLLGVAVNRMGETNALCTDVMNTYFGYDDIPLGLVRKGIDNPQVWIDYSALPTYTDDDGQVLFQQFHTSHHGKSIFLEKFLKCHTCLF